MVYARRRVEHPQPTAPYRAAPAGDPDDPEEPEPPSEGDPSEPDQEEGEEEEESSEPPCAPEEDVELELEVDAGEEAAPEAPQEETEHSSAASPRLPTPRGSVASFLEATPTVDRSMSRHRAEAPVASSEEPVPAVARTVFSTQVTGHLETHTFRDGRTVQVFVADRPIPKTPPADLGEPPQRAASDPPPPTGFKPPPPGVRRPTSNPPAKAGAAVAPRGRTA